MRCLGIDPGSIFLGFGLVEGLGGSVRRIDSGVLRLDKRLGFLSRVSMVAEWFDEYLLLHKPEVVSLEEAFVGRYPLASLKLSQIRGAIIAVASQRKIELFEYSSTLVKRSLAGSGIATKVQIAYMSSKILGLKGLTSLDESDALAVALTHIFMSRGLSSRRLK